MEAFDSKGIINTLERYYVSHGMRWRCNFHFRLLRKFISPGACLFSFPSIFELSSSFIEVSSEIGRKMNYLKAKRALQRVLNKTTNNLFAEDVVYSYLSLVLRVTVQLK